MSVPVRQSGAAGGLLIAFLRDRRAASAVEFSIVAMPFILVLLMILQMGIFYMTQSALNSGVNATADALTNLYYSATPASPPVVVQTCTLPAPSGTVCLTSSILAKGGNLIPTSTLLVDFQPLSNLVAGAVPISNTLQPGQARSLLALRAQVTVTSFVPFIQRLLVIRASATVLRQGN